MSSSTLSSSDQLQLLLQCCDKYLNSQCDEDSRGHLVQCLQNHDYREVVETTENKSDLADVFVEAGEANHVDVLEAFLAHGMNVDIKNQSGSTALMTAARFGHNECFRFLLHHNADGDAQNTCTGDSVLMIACGRNQVTIVEMLLEKNVNPDLQGLYGWTALMLACHYSYGNIVQMLLNHGADVDLKDDDGRTCLELAEDKEIKEMLRNHVNNRYVLK